MAHRWYLLIHQIPPKPLYLRAKIRQRLAKVGAVALKNSVYVLPASADTLEDLQWIAEEVASGGGQSWICGDQILGGADDDSLVESFQSARAGDYAEMRAQLADLGKRAARAKSPTPAAEIDATLARLREDGKRSGRSISSIRLTAGRSRP